MNIVIGVLIVIVTGVGLWIALPWWSIALWTAGVLVIVWLVGLLVDWLRELISGVLWTVRSKWIALPPLVKLASIGIAGSTIVGGTYIGIGSPGYHRLILATAPLLVGWTGSEPSYNAMLSPRFEGPLADGKRGVVVRAGTQTHLSFGISPRWLADSVLKANPNPKITRSADDVPLTVTLTCNFCAEHPAFIEHMIYKPAKRSSNFVTFDFVPMPSDGVGNSRLDARLVLSIVNTSSGIEYDRLAIPAELIGQGTASNEIDTRIALGEEFERSLSRAPEAVADARLVLFQHQNDMVQIEVQPIQEDLIRALKPYVFDGDSPKRFTTGTLRHGELQKVTTGAYARMSELTLQGPQALGVAGAIISKRSMATSKLDDSEASHVRDAIALTGQQFGQGDRNP